MTPTIDRKDLICTLCGQNGSKYPITLLDQDAFVLNPCDGFVYHYKCLNNDPAIRKPPNREFLVFSKGHFCPRFSIVVLGESYTGKTDLIRRFVENKYISPNAPPASASAFDKKVKLGGRYCSLLIWDIPSLRWRSAGLYNHILERADSVLLAYDFAGDRSDTLTFFGNIIREQTDIKAIKAVFTTKMDLKDKSKEYNDLYQQQCRYVEEFANENGWYSFQTSAKEGIQVDDLFHTVTSDLLQELVGKYSLSVSTEFPYVTLSTGNPYQETCLSAEEEGVGVNDTNSLIEEYLRMDYAVDGRNHLTFIDSLETHEKFYKKLLNHLKSNRNLTTTEERVLKEVVQYSWMRIATMKEHAAQFSTVSDLNSFAKVINAMLQMFQESQRKNAISGHSKHYFDKMELKIIEVKKCIDKNVVVIADQVENQLKLVEQRALFEFQAYYKVARKKAVLRCFSVILKVLGFLPDLLTMVDKTLPVNYVKYGISGMTFLVGHLDPSVESPKAFHCNNVDNQEMLLQDTKLMLAKQISVLENTIRSNHKLDSLSSWVKSMAEVSEQLDKNGEMTACQGLELLRKLDGIRDGIYSEIKNIKSEFLNDWNLQSLMDGLYLQLVAAETDAVLYSRPASTWWEVLTKIFTKQQRRIEQRQDSFSKKFVPMANRLVSLTRIHFEMAAGESAAKMMTAEWKLEAILNGVKCHLESFVKGMRVEGAIISCITRLQEAIQKNLKLLKLIRHYEEMISQAELMEGLAIPEESFIGSLFQSRDLKANKNKADCLTKLSLLLLEVDKCIHSFNLLVFPSGHQYLKDIQSQREAITEMSQDIDPQKIGDVAQKCVQLVNYVQLKLDKHYAEITDHDRYWQRGYFSNDYKSTGAFYTWTNATHAFEISQFLLGLPVYFNADVGEYPEGKGAIKYNRTLKFNILPEIRNDDSLKNELMEYLKYFTVTFETGDVCHYKLFGNIYTVETGEGLSFAHSMEKHRDDNSINVSENMMLFKLKEHMFSPFTTWTVQLHLASDKCNDIVSFEKLHEKFANRVQVELEGWGMFIDERVANPQDFEEVTQVYKNLLKDSEDI